MSTPPPWTGPGDAALSSSGRRRKMSPRARLAFVWTHSGVFGIGVLFAFFIAISSYHSAQVSSATQHGPRIAATITSVDRQYHSGRYGGHYTSTLDATPTVVGAAGTPAVVTIHYPGNACSCDVGTVRTVAIDPKRPSYAEFPGDPSTSMLVPWVAAGIGSACVISVVLGLLGVRRVRAGIGRTAVGPGP